MWDYISEVFIVYFISMQSEGEFHTSYSSQRNRLGEMFNVMKFVRIVP